jgi:hypothetical protein
MGFNGIFRHAVTIQIKTDLGDLKRRLRKIEINAGLRGCVFAVQMIRRQIQTGDNGLIVRLRRSWRRGVGRQSHAGQQRNRRKQRGIGITFKFE